MSVFLTLGVYSLKVSSDFPMQSDSIPYIIIYYMMCVFFTFISLAWFVAFEYFKSLQDVPKAFRKLVEWMNLLSLRNRCRVKSAEALDKIEPTCQKVSILKTINVLIFWCIGLSQITALLTIFLMIISKKKQNLERLYEAV